MIPVEKKPDDVVQRCEYSRCKDLAIGDVRFNGRAHPLCIEHLKPEYHPLDLREKITEWTS